MRQLLDVGSAKQAGFSIVELMTVVFISALLLAVALPSYENFVQNNASISMASRLATAMRVAQAEAIKRGIPVTICPISSTFNPTAAFNESTEEWPCQATTSWDAWKIFVDPNLDATEDFSNGWPVIAYVKNTEDGVITSNISGPVTFDPMGFANIDPSATRTGWTWSNSYNGSGEWNWSYAYTSSYTGSYYRVFVIAPPGCTGDNGRSVEINQNGLIVVSNSAC